MQWIRVFYKRMVSDLSIFNKIFYGVLIIVFLIIAVSSTFSFLYSRNIYEKEAANNAATLVENINTGFADNLDQVDRIIQSIYSSSDYADSQNSLKQVLSTKTFSSALDELKALNVVQNFFQRLMFLRKDFNSIYIYKSKDKNFSYTLNGTNKAEYDPTQERWYHDTVAADGNTIISAPHKPYQLNYNKDVISYSRLIKNLDHINSDPYGVILIDFSLSSLSSIVDKVNLGATTGVLFFDGDGNVIYANDKKMEDKAFNDAVKSKIMSGFSGEFMSTLHNTQYLVSFSTSNVMGWKLLTLTPYSEVVKDAHNLLLFDLLLGLIALIFTIVLSFAFSKFMYKPIQKLKNGIDNVKVGNFDFQLQTASNDELGHLITSFNSMVFTIKTLISEKYDEMLARKDAEFKYLQAQINPHFIYNTLQIISSMAIVHQVPDINTVSKSLAKIMRYSLSVNNKSIAIRDEMEVVVSYLDIQKLRFREYLTYEIDMDEGIYDFSIMKLVLQPIVENCINHGIEPKGANGIISVRGMLEDGLIRIQIEDNGVGMSEAETENLLKIINLPEEANHRPQLRTSHNNVGLRNINQRLKLIYGQSHGIHIESSQGQWTRVVITIPAQLQTVLIQDEV